MAPPVRPDERSLGRLAGLSGEMGEAVPLRVPVLTGQWPLWALCANSSGMPFRGEADRPLAVASAIAEDFKCAIWLKYESTIFGADRN